MESRLNDQLPAKLLAQLHPYFGNDTLIFDFLRWEKDHFFCAKAIAACIVEHPRVDKWGFHDDEEALVRQFDAFLKRRQKVTLDIPALHCALEDLARHHYDVEEWQPMIQYFALEENDSTCAFWGYWKLRLTASHYDIMAQWYWIDAAD